MYCWSKQKIFEQQDQHMLWIVGSIILAENECGVAVYKENKIQVINGDFSRKEVS